jgi:ribosome-binding factor A
LSKRLARLNEQLRREISELIRRDVRDPRVGLVTVTGVDVARDLGSAKVYVRAPGTPKERATTLEGLGAAAPFLRTTLGRTLRVRKVPELRFRLDRSYEHAQRIEEVLSEVITGDDSDGLSSEGVEDDVGPDPDATEAASTDRPGDDP